MLAFTFKLGQKQAQLRSPMETVKICSKCVGSTINAGSGFHGSSVLRLLLYFLPWGLGFNAAYIFVASFNRVVLCVILVLRNGKRR